MKKAIFLMTFDKSKCKHPGKGRRLLTFLLPIGEPAALMLNQFGIFLQKIANTIRFEHFWKRHVASNPDTMILPSFTRSRSKHPIWDIATAHARALGDTGIVLEFGTNNGGSLLYLCNHLPSTMTFHGFDCYEGIPEPWDSLPKGAIKGFGFPIELWTDYPDELIRIEKEVIATGSIPQPPQKNIRIHKGLFAHTLPSILSTGVPQDIRLIHFDADIYMGTRPVLDTICGQIDYRYYILFDELYSANHEFKAWIEFIELFNIEKWKVIAISEDGVQALIEVN
jgi:hypothetical protein